MIRINLMPRADARRQAARRRHARLATLILMLLGATLLASELVTRRKASEAQRMADDNRAELIQTSKKHEDAILLEKKRGELKAKLETIATLERQRTGPVHMLDDLSAATPDKLWLTDVIEAAGSMTLSGRGLDNQTIAAFMRNLAASPYFANVDLVETKQIEDGQAQLKQFSIKAGVIYAGRPAPVVPEASSVNADHAIEASRDLRQAEASEGAMEARQ